MVDDRAVVRFEVVVDPGPCIVSGPAISCGLHIGIEIIPLIIDVNLQGVMVREPHLTISKPLVAQYRHHHNGLLGAGRIRMLHDLFGIHLGCQAKSQELFTGGGDPVFAQLPMRKSMIKTAGDHIGEERQHIEGMRIKLFEGRATVGILFKLGDALQMTQVGCIPLLPIVFGHPLISTGMKFNESNNMDNMIRIHFRICQGRMNAHPRLLRLF